MSVILDSLRRARGGSPAPRITEPPSIGTPRPVPEGLRTTPGVKKKAAPAFRPRVMIAVLVAGVGVWATVQFGLGWLRRDVPQQVSFVQPTTPAASEASGAGRASGASEVGGAGEASEVSGASGAGKASGEGSTPPASLASSTPPASAPPPAPSTPPASATPPPARPRPAAPRPAPPLAAAPAAPPMAMVATPPVARPNESFELATKYQAMGNFLKAEENYRAVLEADEFHLQARHNLGMLYYERGLYNEAIEQLATAVRIDGTYLPAHRHLGAVYLAAGRLAEARVTLEAARRLEPRDVGSVVNLALVEMKAEKPGVAMDLLLKAIVLDNKHPLAHYNLGYLYDQAGEVTPALKHYRSFLDNATSEYANLIVDVQARIDTLAQKLIPAGR